MNFDVYSAENVRRAMVDTTMLLVIMAWCGVLVQLAMWAVTRNTAWLFLAAGLAVSEIVLIPIAIGVGKWAAR